MPPSKVDEVITDMATCDRTFPYRSVRWALDNWHEAGPRFVQLLEDCVTGADRSENTIAALFFVVHLLAEKAETRIFPTLCSLADDERLCEDVLGDAITETLRGLLISTWNGEAAPLKQVIESESANEFARAAAVDALAYLTRKGEFADDDTRAYWAHLAKTMQPRNESFVWSAWAIGAASLGYEEFRGDVVDLTRRGFINPRLMGPDHFDVQLRRTLADPSGWAGFVFDRVGPFTDTIGSLSGWGHFTAPEAEDGAMPYVDPWRKVGRNDPCPCGSGKKYKKCCLQ